MRIIEILRRIWLFYANKIKTSESVSKQSTQLKLELNSSLRQKLGTLFSWKCKVLLADVRMLQVTIVIDEGGLPKYATRYHYLSPMYCRPGGLFSNQVGPRGKIYTMDII